MRSCLSAFSARRRFHARNLAWMHSAAALLTSSESLSISSRADLRRNQARAAVCMRRAAASSRSAFSRSTFSRSALSSSAFSRSALFSSFCTADSFAACMRACPSHTGQNQSPPGMTLTPMHLACPPLMHPSQSRNLLSISRASYSLRPHCMHGRCEKSLPSLSTLASCSAHVPASLS